MSLPAPPHLRELALSPHTPWSFIRLSSTRTVLYTFFISLVLEEEEEKKKSNKRIRTRTRTRIRRGKGEEREGKNNSNKKNRIKK